MKSVTEIPELVKIMISLFGEQWGRRLGRIIVILFIIALAVTAIIVPLFSNIPFNVVIWILSLITLLVTIVGIPTMLGLFFGMIIRVGFATPTTIRIDNTLNELLPLLQKIDRHKLDSEAMKELIEDTKKVRAQWNDSKIVRFVRWVKKPESKKGKGAK